MLLKEDYEFEAQKDKLYLLEKAAELEKSALFDLLSQEAGVRHPGEATLLVSDHPKDFTHDTAPELDYSVPLQRTAPRRAFA